MRIEEGDECSIHDRVWEGDYRKSRDVKDIVEEAFEAGWNTCAYLRCDKTYSEYTEGDT